MATQTATKPSLTIKRRLKAPPTKVFAAWTDPEKVKRWMGPGEVKVLAVECEPRAGGRYRWLMRAPSGEDHDVSGVYREFVPDRKLLFTWAWKSTPERVAGHRRSQARRRRHALDAHPRAVLRRRGARPPPPRLGRRDG